jgi:hypothetical protein
MLRSFRCVWWEACDFSRGVAVFLTLGGGVSETVLLREEEVMTGYRHGRSV